MEQHESTGIKEDFEVIERFLPHGWQDKARELGALRRTRKFKDAESLLRALLVHLGEGLSLRATAARLEQGRVVSVSDVALLKRLRNAGPWLRWMAEQVMRTWCDGKAELPGGFTAVRVLDATRVKEPGPTGSHWRIFYSIRLPDLTCDEFRVEPVSVGETFLRYTMHPGELVIADRGHAHPKGIRAVREAGADMLVRINLTNVPLCDAQGGPLRLLEHLRPLRIGEVADFSAFLAGDVDSTPMRVCALRTSAAAAAKAKRRAETESSSKKHRVRPDTIEAAGFVIVLTSLSTEQASAKQIMRLYRARWQVELAFKHLKSLAGLGHLKKHDPAAARAWLTGKLLVAMLIQAYQTAARSFSPWGYPLEPDRS